MLTSYELNLPVVHMQHQRLTCLCKRTAYLNRTRRDIMRTNHCRRRAPSARVHHVDQNHAVATAWPGCRPVFLTGRLNPIQRRVMMSWHKNEAPGCSRPGRPKARNGPYGAARRSTPLEVARNVSAMNLSTPPRAVESSFRAPTCRFPGKGVRP